jgi:hypothetical protein
MRQGALFALTWRQMTIQDRVIEMGHRRAIGEWLAKHVQKRESVYLEPFGYIGYFSGARIVDWPGLVAPEVVRVRRESRQRTQGAEPIVHAASELRPDWMVLRPDEVAAMSGAEFFAKYALVKTFNANPRLREYECVPGPGWLRFDAHLSVFRKLSGGPEGTAFREVPVSVEPTRVNPSDTGPTLVFELPQPMRVTAVRLKFAYDNPTGPPSFTFSWRQPANIPDGTEERILHWPQAPTTVEQTRLFWIDDTIDLFRITPDDKPSGFRLKEIVLLQPAAQSS